MNLTEFIFILQLLAFMILVLYKFYNVITGGRAMDMASSFVVQAGILFSWIVGMIVVLVDYSTLFYGVIFTFQNWIVLLSFVFLAIEGIYVMRNSAMKNSRLRDRYSPRG